jgi:hypothetical protein
MNGPAPPLRWGVGSSCLKGKCKVGDAPGSGYRLNQGHFKAQQSLHPSGETGVEDRYLEQRCCFSVIVR